MSIKEFVNEEVGLIRRLFSNGGKWLLIANTYFVAAMTVLAIALIFAFCLPEDGEFSPLRNVNPQPILGSPVTEPGGVVTNEAEKCNDSDESVSYDVRSYLQGMTDRKVRILTSATDGVVRAPGCTTSVFTHVIPDDLPLGTFRYEGIEIVRSNDGETQIANWFTENFFVVEGADD